MSQNNNNKVATLIKKKLSEKKHVDDYLQGKIAIEELRSKGIEFVTPL